MDNTEIQDSLKDVRDKAAAVVFRLGGFVTPRVLAKHMWRFRRCARSVLQTMVEKGYGNWVDVPPGPKGGRPSLMFVLNDATAKRIGETSPAGPLSPQGTPIGSNSLV